MNAITINIPDDMRQKIEEIAASKGVSVETFLGEVTSRMIEEFDAYQQFAAMAERGQHEVDEALALLRRE